MPLEPEPADSFVVRAAWSALPRELQERIAERAFAMLPEELQAVLLAAHTGRTDEEIAENVGLTVPALKVSLRHARTLLYRFLVILLLRRGDQGGDAAGGGGVTSPVFPTPPSWPVGNTKIMN